MDKLFLLLIFICSACDDTTNSIDQSNQRGVYDHCPAAESLQTNAQPILDHLLITEISPLYAINRSIWFELYNPSNQPITLNKFQLRSQAILNQQEPTAASVQNEIALFDLPNVILEPKQHIVVMSAIPFQLEIQQAHLDGLHSKNQAMHHEHSYHDNNLIKLTNPSSTFFWDNQAGFLELLEKDTQTTIDFVHFGSDIHQPRNTQQWHGEALTRYQHPNEATSLARHVPYQDSNQHHDWSLSTFNTPGGTNLTFPSTDDGQINLTLTETSIDVDHDGIPDDKEVDCAYFNDLPYYAWGARPQQTDIFVQVDYMDNRPTPIIPDLTKPSLAALRKWENIYIQYAPNLPNHSTGPLYPIRVHIDTGSLHALAGQEHQVNTDRYNLYSHDTDRHGGTVLPYKSITYFNPDAYDYPLKNMDPRRDPVFHYMFIAHREVSHMATVGKADQNGQTSGVFLNSIDIEFFSNQTKVDALLASSAAHELGHNLSLYHGGFEDINYKPNYYSIMNYGYANDLIKSDITHTAADISRLQQIHTQACNGKERYFHTVQSNLDKAYLNFSNGSGHDIVLTNINETNQVLSDQIGSIQIDYNNNSTFETSMSCRIAHQHITATLKDNNDWVMMRDGSISAKYSYQEVDGYPVASSKLIIGCEK